MKLFYRKREAQSLAVRSFIRVTGIKGIEEFELEVGELNKNALNIFQEFNNFDSETPFLYVDELKFGITGGHTILRYLAEEKISEEMRENFAYPRYDIKKRAEIDFLMDWHLNSLSIISKYQTFKLEGEENYDQKNRFKIIWPNKLLYPNCKKHLGFLQNSFLEKLRGFHLNEKRKMASLVDILIFSELMILNTLGVEMKKYGEIIDYILRLNDEISGLRTLFDEEIRDYCKSRNIGYFLDLEIGQLREEPNL